MRRHEFPQRPQLSSMPGFGSPRKGRRMSQAHNQLWLSRNWARVRVLQPLQGFYNLLTSLTQRHPEWPDVPPHRTEVPNNTGICLAGFPCTYRNIECRIADSSAQNRNGRSLSWEGHVDRRKRYTWYWALAPPCPCGHESVHIK